MEELLALTRSPEARVRSRALRDLCPCKLKRNEDVAWDRVFEMAADPDPKVRSMVLHTICDGSPNTRSAEVVAALEALSRDEDKGLRRRARDVLAKYRRTGRVNFL